MPPCLNEALKLPIAVQLSRLYLSTGFNLWLGPLSLRASFASGLSKISCFLQNFSNAATHSPRHQPPLILLVPIPCLNLPSFSVTMTSATNPHCLRLFIHTACFPLALALANAGKSIPARMAIIATTTSNSIKVNPLFLLKNPLNFIVRDGQRKGSPPARTQAVFFNEIAIPAAYDTLFGLWQSSAGALIGMLNSSVRYTMAFSTKFGERADSSSLLRSRLMR